ncbi:MULTISPECIES: hypothetical protein [unclassified Clostridium]|uniref:hypothetical protein n=1 Tax=unclassified Clostridium TaxID=2614128 RepID=UPI002A7F9241|nr:hypothetical protein [Clostridium sp.]MDY4253625.1 hypothetical protein [Clostridium sp.]
MERFIIKKNYFLTKKDTLGYFHQVYTGYKQKDNPNFINVLKNTFNSENITNLINARDMVIRILMQDIPCIIQENNLYKCVCICVPRAKVLNSYYDKQLYFKNAVSIAANKINGVIDGTNYIIRIKNTYTTHLSKASRDGIIENDGKEPYKGITIDTCSIEKSRIEAMDIILIDDIYTKNVNIDEDCIQALFDNGARNVIYYSIGYTRRI